MRPLLDDAEDNAAEVTRDYQLEVVTEGAPLLNVFGGKLTTYRKLAEEAVDRLTHALGTRKPAWTARGEALPGGEQRDIASLLERVGRARPGYRQRPRSGWCATTAPAPNTCLAMRRA